MSPSKTQRASLLLRSSGRRGRAKNQSISGRIVGNPDITVIWLTPTSELTVIRPELKAHCEWLDECLGGDDLAGFQAGLHVPLAFLGKLRYSPYEITGEAMDKTRLELFRGTLDVLILKSLIWGPLHGYSITDFIRRHSDDLLLVEEGTLYPALWRLENKELVEAEWGLSENNRKAKFYRLTRAGRKRLQRESTNWEAYATAVAKVLGATHLTSPEEPA